MPQYKLTYFNARGRAEVSRLIFAQVGVEYEDKRVSFEEWGQLKPQTPFGYMPILEVDGKVLSGSGPIARFLAERYGLAGTNDVENAEIAGIADHFKDFTAEYIKWSYEKDEARKAEIKKKLDEEITPKYLTNFEKQITADGWLYGSKVTYVDLLFFDFSPHIPEGMLPKYPGLKALIEKVEVLPNIAKWLKDRPDTPW